MRGPDDEELDTVTIMDSLQRAALARQLRQDPPPMDPETGEPDELVRVKVQSRSDCLVLPNGNVVNAGENVVTVYRSQVERIEAMVEDATPADLERVERDLAWHEEQAKKSADHGRHYYPSWSASFREVMKRDPRPLISAEVLERKRGPGRPKKSSGGDS